MGYSLPAAIGAKLARPEKTVLAVMGDGAFQMCFNELATIMGLALPVKIVLLNNGTLGLVRELQRNAGLEAFAVDLPGSPDYGMIASAYGIGYARAADTPSAVGAARDMLEREGAYLLECVVDPEETT